MHIPPTHALETRFIPAQQASTRLAIVLHGLGDSMEGFAFLPQFLAIPWLNYLLVNAPNPYFTGYAWYDIDNPTTGILESREKLQALFAELDAARSPTQDRILSGFSQGCLMSIDFALRYDKPLAGIIGISGYAAFLSRLATETTEQARKQAWLITHGTVDELLPLERTRAQMEQIKAVGVPLEWHEFHKGHTLDVEDEMPLIRDWIIKRWK
ncbi:MAG TPA: serine esterase [bacterium]